MYAKTDRGFMTQELFGLALNKVVDLVRESHPDAPILIFADRPQCHNSNELVISLRTERDAHLLWFPANTSQVIQPLDGQPYATMKTLLKQERDDVLLRRTLCGEKLTQVVAEISPEVERRAFTPDVIKGGFKDRGVWPFDAELILKRSAEEFVRAPCSSSVVVNEAQEAMTALIAEKQPAKVQQHRVAGITNKNTLYTPTQLIEFEKEKVERERKEAEDKEAEKTAKAEAKQKKKEMKEAEQREKAEKREAKKKEKAELMERKKKAQEEKRAAMSQQRGVKRPTFLVDDDDEFVDDNDENDYPVNKPGYIISTKRQRANINYTKFAKSGNKEDKE